MRRGFDYAFLAVLGVALAHGVAWSIVGLTFGLLVVGLAGGWLIGYAVRLGVAERQTDAPARDAPAPDAPAPPAPAGATGVDAQPGPPVKPPRGMSTLAAVLGLVTWLLGSFVAFFIVQLAEGQGDLLARLTPANFAAFMNSLLEPPLLQAAVLAAYVVVGWLSARPSTPRQAARAP